jgi:hypothetical protein
MFERFIPPNRVQQVNPLPSLIRGSCISFLPRVQRIADVHQQWQNPAHDWGDKTAWRLFNAATFALAGKVAERPDLTKQLHQVIDGTCTRH